MLLIRMAVADVFFSSNLNCWLEGHPTGVRRAGPGGRDDNTVLWACTFATSPSAGWIMTMGTGATPSLPHSLTPSLERLESPST